MRDFFKVSMLPVRRDPFARVQYYRFCGTGECANCGQNRDRVYSYVWWEDDKPKLPNYFDAEYWFCNLKCFDQFNC